MDERLEEISKRARVELVEIPRGYTVKKITLSDYDYDWLIQQAGKVPGLERDRKYWYETYQQQKELSRGQKNKLQERVQELERDRAEWEIESHTQNSRNKRLEQQFNDLYRKHFIKVEQLEQQIQRYKDVKEQLETIYDVEDAENPIIKNEYIGGYLQGLDRAIDLLEYAHEGE